MSLDRVLSFCVCFVGTVEALKFINKKYVSIMISVVKTLKIKEFDTPMPAIIDWMQNNPRIGLLTFDLSQSEHLNTVNLQQLVETIPSVFPNLKFLNIQMCQQVFSLPIAPLPFIINIGGCLGLCNNPDIYNYLRPSEFVLTHTFMIKYGYNDSFLFVKSHTWLKNLVAYEYFTAMPFRSVVKVTGVFLPPRLCRKGQILRRTGYCRVYMKHGEDLITWKLKRNDDGFWRTSRIMFKF